MHVAVSRFATSYRFTSLTNYKQESQYINNSTIVWHSLVSKDYRSPLQYDGGWGTSYRQDAVSMCVYLWHNASCWLPQTYCMLTELMMYLEHCLTIFTGTSKVTDLYLVYLCHQIRAHKCLAVTSSVCSPWSSSHCCGCWWDGQTGSRCVGAGRSVAVRGWWGSGLRPGLMNPFPPWCYRPRGSAGAWTSGSAFAGQVSKQGCSG